MNERRSIIVSKNFMILRNTFSYNNNDHRVSSVRYTRYVMHMHMHTHLYSFETVSDIISTEFFFCLNTCLRDMRCRFVFFLFYSKLSDKNVWFICNTIIIKKEEEYTTTRWLHIYFPIITNRRSRHKLNKYI